MTAKRSSPPQALAEDARRARVLPQVDRAERLLAMLDRWDAEEVADEPDWDVTAIAPLKLRSRSSES